MPRWMLTAGACLAAAVFLLPHLLIPRWLPAGSPYDPLPVLGTDLQTFESSMNAGGTVHEATEGSGIVRDPSLFEHKHGPVFEAPLASLLDGAVARLVGVVRTTELADAVLPALTFILAALLTFALTRSVGAAALAGVGVLFGYEFVQRFPPLSVSALHGFGQLFTIGGPGNLPFNLARFPFPELSLPALLAALLLVLRALEKPSRGRLLAAGVVCGLQLPLYLYNGGFILGTLAVLSGLSAVLRDRTTTRTAGTILVITLTLGIPSFLNALPLRHLPAGTLERLGLEHGRTVELARSLEVALLALAAGFTLGIRRLPGRLVLSALLAGIVLMNTQLLTGVSLQRWHWFARVLNPLSVITLAAIAARLLRRIRFTQVLRTSALVLTAAMFLWAGARAYGLARAATPAHTLPVADQTLLEWLNANAPNGAVVGTPSFATIALIPSRTTLNVYVPFGGMTLAGNDELIDRYLRLAKLLGISETTVRDVFAYNPTRHDAELAACSGFVCRLDWTLKDRNATEQLLTFTYLTVRSGLTTYTSEIRMPDAEVDRLVERYRALPTDPGTLPGPYRLDYVVLGERERALGATPLPATAVRRTVELPGWTIQEFAK